MKKTIQIGDPLTGRERDVAALVALDYTNKEIATRLKIKPVSVKAYLQVIFKKTGVTNRLQLAAMMAKSVTAKDVFNIEKVMVANKWSVLAMETNGAITWTVLDINNQALAERQPSPRKAIKAALISFSRPQVTITMSVDSSKVLTPQDIEDSKVLANFKVMGDAALGIKHGQPTIQKQTGTDTKADEAASASEEGQGGGGEKAKVNNELIAEKGGMPVPHNLPVRAEVFEEGWVSHPGTMRCTKRKLLEGESLDGDGFIVRVHGDKPFRVVEAVKPLNVPKGGI